MTPDDEKILRAFAAAGILIAARCAQHDGLTFGPSDVRDKACARQLGRLLDRLEKHGEIEGNARRGWRLAVEMKP